MGEEEEAGCTKGQVGGGGGRGYQGTGWWKWRQGVPRDRLVEVEAGSTKGQVGGGGGRGYQGTGWWRWRQRVPRDRLVEVEAGGGGGHGRRTGEGRGLKKKNRTF